jgi:hypothetical protein
VTLPNGPLVLGIALVDFNHLVFLLLLGMFKAENSDRSGRGLSIAREISLRVRR